MSCVVFFYLVSNVVLVVLYYVIQISLIVKFAHAQLYTLHYLWSCLSILSIKTDICSCNVGFGANCSNNSGK